MKAYIRSESDSKDMFLELPTVVRLCIVVRSTRRIKQRARQTTKKDLLLEFLAGLVRLVSVCRLKQY